MDSLGFRKLMKACSKVYDFLFSQNNDNPPTIPLRKINSRTPSGSPNRSRPTSFSSSGEGLEDGPRPPPRVTSVRRHGLERSTSSQGSRESLDQLDNTSPSGSGRTSPQV